MSSSAFSTKCTKETPDLVDICEEYSRIFTLMSFSMVSSWYNFSLLSFSLTWCCSSISETRASFSFFIFSNVLLISSIFLVVTDLFLYLTSFICRLHSATLAINSSLFWSNMRNSFSFSPANLSMSIRSWLWWLAAMHFKQQFTEQVLHRSWINSPWSSQSNLADLSTVYPSPIVPISWVLRLGILECIFLQSSHKFCRQFLQNQLTSSSLLHSLWRVKRCNIP